MRLFSRFLVLNLLIWNFYSCDTTKSTAPSGDCQTIGTVKDMTGLDGCKFLIETKDGKLLLPVEVSDSRFKLVDGAKIAFDYVQNKKVSFGICQAEDMMVNITCIKSLDGAAKDECVDTNSPAKVTWMKTLIEKHKPMRISKYPYNDQLLYFFQAKPNSLAYDCKGQLVCEVINNEKDLCYEQIQSMGRGKVIWVGEGIPD